MGSSGTARTSTPTKVWAQESCHTSARSPAAIASMLRTIGMAASRRQSANRQGTSRWSSGACRVRCGPGSGSPSSKTTRAVNRIVDAVRPRHFISRRVPPTGGRNLTTMSIPTRPNVVLVHGGFVDGSGWQGVYDRLKADGYNVAVVQNPTVSLEGDVAATKQVLDDLDGPVVLVGHSYGGAVVTEAGAHPKVAAVVYIAAFAPDKGESVNTLIADPPPGAPVPPILPPRGGYLFLDRDKFAASFAADLPPAQARFMADSQVPWGVGALDGSVTDPAWRSKPSWYLVATEDRMIPPPAQRAMSERAGSSVTEVAGSHSIYVSQPAAVADLIE